MLIKIRDLFGASDKLNDKSLIEQPANERAVVGLEGTSGVGRRQMFAAEDRVSTANADGRYPKLAAFGLNYHGSIAV